MVLDAQGSQLAGGPASFPQGGVVGTCDEHHGRDLFVHQRVHGCRKAVVMHRQTRMGSEARSPVIVRFQERRPSARKLQKSQRMAGWGGVENDVVVDRSQIAPGKEAGKLVERGNLRGARARELLANLGNLFCGLHSLVGLDHAPPVGFRRGIGIDVHRVKVIDLGNRTWFGSEYDTEHFVEVRRRIGADEQHPVPAIGERKRRGARERRFATSALAREKEVACGGKKGIHSLLLPPALSSVAPAATYQRDVEDPHPPCVFTRPVIHVFTEPSSRAQKSRLFAGLKRASVPTSLWVPSMKSGPPESPPSVTRFVL